MDTEKTSLYNRPDIYDIHFSGKMAELLRKHYEIVLSNKEICTIHDCSYGTGNLTNELARMGYHISGSDLSKEMLSRAEEKINAENLKIKLTQSDFRDLTTNIKDKFDCVMSTGNSLAHVSNEDVKKVLYQMAQLIKKKGYIYIDTRNWDRILSTRQRFYYYQPFFKNDERINAMQVWDCNSDGTITFNLLFSFEKEKRIYQREELKNYIIRSKKNYWLMS
ncbi:class I SAM-dependent methyltransferase [Alkaliphilus serpentinus]|uniref:Class I SAM-dependent methyltransferase n=1 Tax=Alkaliphilus serpentinus TaxID=1482731 RepID=A0A833HNL3_9FIRM|nr:class I SAM-dependent methyltransferase [Alkaliphilus serpentinus]KAB3529607.1 class I SAM-dependent methyltransferase [Alkaliphilus serpentinus]